MYKLMLHDKVPFHFGQKQASRTEQIWHALDLSTIVKVLAAAVYVDCKTTCAFANSSVDRG